MTAADVPDLLVLAAIDRAVRHTRPDSNVVPKPAILRHLDIHPRSRLARQVRARLAALERSGLVEPRRQQSMDTWKLTDKGHQRLAQARAAHDLPELPESLRHRAWRQQRALAEQNIERFRSELSDALKDCGLAQGETDPPSSSDTWQTLGIRLLRCCLNIASAVCCLHEWDKPNDDQADRAQAKFVPD
jgi:hypothetical protein